MDTALPALRISNISVLAASRSGRMLNHPALPCRIEMLPSHIYRRSVHGRLMGCHQTWPKSSFRRSSLLSTHCTMRSGVESNSATNTNPQVELDSDSKSQQLVASPPNQPYTSSCTRGMVLDMGPPKAWDAEEVGSPVVKRYIGDDEERWYMWYQGKASENEVSSSIGLALSKNGIHWARGAGAVSSCGDVGLVMNDCESWWAFDTKSILPSELVIMSGPMYSSVYWLYYTGYSSDEVKLPEDIKICFQNTGTADLCRKDSKSVKIFKSLPGLACSQDGRHWGRIEGDHHSGSLLDVGSVDEWDSLFIAAPNVVLHQSDDLRMHYCSYDSKRRHFGVGLARSRDGIRWVKLGKIMGGGESGSFDELGVISANVVRNPRKGNYLMAYEGLSATRARAIGLAESLDGLTNWTRIQEDPILEPSGADGWDNRSVGSPSLVQMEGNSAGWRLYYEGVGKGGRTGIGMAVCKTTEPIIFKRWEGLQS